MKFIFFIVTLIIVLSVHVKCNPKPCLPRVICRTTPWGPRGGYLCNRYCIYQGSSSGNCEDGTCVCS
ncbi:CLUMA_CG000104, isoform A [Clunio marinus]|uniref:CLUMA_CG000104, isoform A n=1 Tax=Clunio marinus TaxID=568069 RepID=A0A1J1HDX8_9DIPT|nr:CLUMA_CG000104, isoform A [Clunio marinus]